MNKTDQIFEEKKEYKLKTWKFEDKEIIMWYNKGKVSFTYVKLKNFCTKKGMSEDEYNRRIAGQGFSVNYFFKDGFMQEFLEYCMK